jgi:hypothetical protein
MHIINGNIYKYRATPIRKKIKTKENTKPYYNDDIYIQATIVKNKKNTMTEQKHTALACTNTYKEHNRRLPNIGLGGDSIFYSIIENVRQTIISTEERTHSE